MNAVLSNLIIILVVSILFISACLYIYKEKKKGRHCIGCPMAGKCPRHYSCKGVKTMAVSAKKPKK